MGDDLLKIWCSNLRGVAPAADLERHRLVTEAVLGLRRDPERTRELLEDDSPRIRALAAVALLRTTRAEFLEPVAALATDEATVPVLGAAAVVPPHDPASLRAAETRAPRCPFDQTGDIFLRYYSDETSCSLSARTLQPTDSISGTDLSRAN